MSAELTARNVPPFMVLGIDSGAVSGVALAYPVIRTTKAGSPPPAQPVGIRLGWTDSGKSTPEFRRLWCESAVVTARRRGAHLLVVHEKFVGRPHVIRGSAKQVGKWLHVLEELGVRRAQVHEVLVSRWRRDTFGHNRRLGTDRWKRAAQERCTELFGLDIEHDAAEAALQAAWGVLSSDVLRRIPKRRRKPCR